jgi:hypothetical protein
MFNFNLKEVLKYSVKENKLQDNSAKPTLQRSKSRESKSSTRSGNLKDQNTPNTFNG